MEDFHFAGGLPGFLARLTDVLHLDRPTVAHTTLREQLDGALVHNGDVIRERDNPLAEEGGVAVLRGNLCPDGAVIKHIAAEPHLLRHTGPAVVFDDYKEMQRTINDPALALTPDHVLVLRNAGPKGGPGMPEYGMLPIPDYLLKQGVRDMVRISDARMSGTSYGACVLHVAPESFVGGPLALVRTGDLDHPGRRGAPAPPRRDRRGAGAAQGPVDTAARPVRARLRRALPGPDHPGRHRMRLRVPGEAGRRARPVRGLNTGRREFRAPTRPAHRTTCGKRFRTAPRNHAPPHGTSSTSQRSETVMAQSAAVATPPPTAARRRRPAPAACRIC